MFYVIFLAVQVVVSILLIVVILLQSAKGGGLAGSAFGGGPSTAFLGARGTATFLSRATTVLAIIFLLGSLGLSLMVRGFGGPVSVTQREIQASGAENLPRVAPGSEFATPQLPAANPGNADNTGQTVPVQQAPGDKAPPGGEQNP